jgi:hypothetical protein
LLENKPYVQSWAKVISEGQETGVIAPAPENASKKI